MNYEKNYYDYIAYVKTLNRKKTKPTDPNFVYYENHHIDPKSNGGDNEPDNLVLLTAREHFLAHYLLTKFTTGALRQKMIFALNRMGLQKSERTHGKYMNARLYSINRHEFVSYLSGLFTKKDKVWVQLNNQIPFLRGQDTLDVVLDLGYQVIPDCPICHAANSQDNFCCSDEHWDEFERFRKEAMSKAQSSFIASSWEDESLAAARKAGISNAYAKRRELREAGELDAYVWVKNESLGVQTQVPESDVPEYEASGYVRGRFEFSDEARANMSHPGFKWSEESIQKREATRKANFEEAMKDPAFAKAYHEKRTLIANQCAGKKSKAWETKELSDEWRQMKSDATKAGFAAKKAQAEAEGKSLKWKWAHKGRVSERVLETEYEARLADGWEPGRGKMGEFKKQGVKLAWIHKDEESKRVPVAEIQDWLVKGWEKGR